MKPLIERDVINEARELLEEGLRPADAALRISDGHNLSFDEARGYVLEAIEQR